MRNCRLADLTLEQSCTKNLLLHESLSKRIVGLAYMTHYFERVVLLFT